MPAFRLTDLTGQTANSFKHFTYAHFRDRITQADPADLLIGALQNDQPIGLAYAQVVGETAWGGSLFVVSEHRNRGIATALMSEVERRLSQNGVRFISVGYTVGSCVEALERVFQKRGFSVPELDTWIYRIDTRIGHAAWMGRFPWPRNCRVVNWVDLTPEHRKTIFQGRGLWFPAYLSPFRDESRLDAALSLALLVDDEPAGWCVVHAVAADTRLYPSLVVRPQFQRLGYAFGLVAEAIGRQLAMGIPFGLFAVLCGNQPMMNVVRRWLAPYAVGVTEHRTVSKGLSKLSEEAAGGY